MLLYTHSIEQLKIFKMNKSIKIGITLLVAFLIFSCNSTSKTVATTTQSVSVKETKLENSLLWKISGNGLEKPSYYMVPFT